MTVRLQSLRFVIILGILASMVGQPTATNAESQDFRIETDVYAG